jgi:hypothetical protein
MNKLISDKSIETRKSWIDKINNLAGPFSGNSALIESHLKDEISSGGTSVLLDHITPVLNNFIQV